MSKACAPIDMLRKCREEFAKQVENFDIAKRKAGTVWEANTAEEFGAEAKRFVRAIDATLRDWA